MDHQEGERARRWLAEEGVIEVGEGTWSSDEAPEERLTTNEVAHTWTQVALGDPELDAAGRLRLALDLLDLLDDYWVTSEIRFVLQSAQDPERAELLWDAYRRRLEAPEPADPVTYSLWVDWFEDRTTVEVAFAEVLGNDVEELQARAGLHEMTRDPLFRRAKRVLEISGPVPWPIKHPVYQAVAAVPELHPALFQGLLHSYHDYFGDLEPHAAHALVQELNLPEDTEHLAGLRTVLDVAREDDRRTHGS